MRYGIGRYLVRLVAGSLWFLLMAAFAAALLSGAVALALDPSVGGLIVLILLALAFGRPIVRQWTDDRAEVLSFFRRTPTEPAGDRSEP